MASVCSHLLALDTARLKTAVHPICPECVALGDTWVHVRACQKCGHVGCCDQLKNTHATKHFHASRHPVVSSAESGEY